MLISLLYNANETSLNAIYELGQTFDADQNLMKIKLKMLWM